MKRGRKIASWVAGSIIGVGIVVLGVAPTVLSTPWGTQRMVDWVNSGIAGSVSIEQLNLSWFSGQRLVGLKVRDPAGTEILSVRQAESSSSFFRLLTTCPYVCKASVDGVKALVVQDSEGTTNFAAAFHSKNPSPSTHKQSSSRSDDLAILLPIRGELALSDAHVELRSANLPSVSLRNVQATMNSASHEGPLTIEMQGLSATADLSGSFALKAKLSGFSSGKIALKSGLNGYVTVDPEAHIDVKLKLSQLPSATLDYLATLKFPKIKGIVSEGLGDRINLDFAKTIDSNTMAFSLQAHSPTLDADLQARWHDGAISLAQPGQMTLTVTPAFLSALNPSIKLLKSAQVQLMLDRMTLSSKGSGTPSVRLKLQSDNLQFDGGPTLGAISFTGLQGVLEYLETNQSLLASGEMLLHYNGSHGAVRAQGKFGTKHNQLDTDYMITASKLPSLLLDRIFQADGWFADLVGEQFDGQLTHAASSRGSEIQLEFESEGVSIPTLKLFQRDGVLTAQPEDIQLQATPAFARRLLASQNLVQIQDEADAVLHLKRFRLQTTDKDKILWSNVQIEAGLDVGAVAVSTSQGNVRLASAKASLSGPSLVDAKFDVQVELLSELTAPLAQAAIGKTASVHMSGALGGANQGEDLVLKHSQLSWNSDVLTLQAAGSVDETGRLVLSEPLVGRYNLSPSLLTALGISPVSNPLLSQPVALDLRLDQLSLSLNDFWNKDLLVQLKAKADLIDLTEGPGENFANLEGVTLAMLFDSKACEAGVTLFGTSSLPNQNEKTPFDLDVAVNGWCSDRKWDWTDLNVQAHGNLQQFPVKLLSTLTAQPELTALLGPTVDLKVDMKRVANARGAHDPVKITLNAEGIQLDASFIAGASLVQDPQHPLTMQLDLTPAKFDIFKKMFAALGWNGLNRWQLLKNSKVTITTENWAMPFPNANRNFGPITGTATAAFEPLLIKNMDDGKTLGWESLKTHLASDKNEGDYRVLVEALEVPGASSGTFAASGSIKKAWTKEAGWFNLQQMNGGAKVNASRFALASLLRVIAPDATWSKQIPGLLGETIALDGRFNWSPTDGRLQARVNGSQGRVEMDGSWDNKSLTLHQPLVVEVKLTQQLVDEVLRDIAPVLSSIVPSDQPIRFEINSRQTSIPLSGDTLQLLRLSEARLELGKVLFRGDGQIGQVSALLRGQAALSSAPFAVTFTPLAFSFNNGVVTLQRVDALVADRYPIAMWGTVDLARDKVNLVIGITAQALREAYGITIADERYVLQLPLKGTTANASIDKIKATARITSLVAQSQGGPNGLILGGVLDLIGGGDDQKVPSPAQPLPWPSQTGNEPTAHQTDEESDPPKKVSTRKKIQNKLQQGASKLLNILK